MRQLTWIIPSKNCHKSAAKSNLNFYKLAVFPRECTRARHPESAGIRRLFTLKSTPCDARGLADSRHRVRVVRSTNCFSFPHNMPHCGAMPPEPVRMQALRACHRRQSATRGIRPDSPCNRPGTPGSSHASGCQPRITRRRGCSAGSPATGRGSSRPAGARRLRRSRLSGSPWSGARWRHRCVLS